MVKILKKMERKHKNKGKNKGQVTKDLTDNKIIVIEYHYTKIGEFT